jgi:hypothetical protein
MHLQEFAMRRLFLVLACALCFASAVAGPPPPEARALSAQAGQAYEDKEFAKAAGLFLAAAKAGAGKATSYYNAACSFALAGDKENAFAQLQASIDAGLGGQNPADDADFASLHDDPRWSAALAGYEAKHPENRIIGDLSGRKLPSAARYFLGRKAIAEGAPTGDNSSMFNQYFGTVAQFVGEYDEANRIYGDRNSTEDPVGLGYSQAVDAVPVILARAHGRQAIFLNESHGQAQTRAANFALLAGLRADGFDTLAMETLAVTKPVPRDATHCSNTSIDDAALAARGYPLVGSGYYTEDPVYAELVREALRLGFRLVGYDSDTPEHTVPAREQNEAENLACVFKDDPRARLVVLAGFSHIAKGKDFWVPGGAMAYRFRELSGIDPLSVDTTTLTALDAGKLRFEPSQGHPVSFALKGIDGDYFHNANFDLEVFVPAASHRNDGQPSWLELGGLRRRIAVAREECKDADPCLVEARRVGEDAKAVPGDRCVLAGGGAGPGCTLFLAPGSYDIATFDSAGSERARRNVRVEAE